MKKLLPLLIFLFPCFSYAELPEVIPSLHPTDVYLNLTDRGFTKEGPVFSKDEDGERVRWTLKAGDSSLKFVIDVWGHSGVDNVYKINTKATDVNAISSGKADALVTQVLSYVATVPYEKSQSGVAAAWVTKNIDSDGAETVISGVKYSIQAFGAIRRLKIEMP
jgi:hypothetical protein